jgi:uncharacterized protein (TIGR02466 family)
MASVEYWFPTPLWFANLNVDNKKIETACKNISKKSKGRILSNIGGWQSTDIYFTKENDREFAGLFSLILSEVNQVANGMNLNKQFKVDENSLQFWININQQDNHNLTHNHPRSFLSGVYYVKVPKNSGDLIFEHPYPLMKFWYQYFTESDKPESFSSIFVNPEVGKLVIFPSWLEHRVVLNKSNKKRISIAFNISIS